MSTPAPKNNKKGFNAWIKYSAIGTEMAVAIVLCTLAGYKIDEWMSNETPFATILLLFVGLSAGFYIVYKQLK